MKKVKKLVAAVLSIAMILLMLPQSINTAYAETETDIAEASNEVYATSQTQSKKGLQIYYSMLPDVDDLGISEAFINIVLEDIYSLTPTKYSYSYNGSTYYFKESMVEDYDTIIGKLTNAGIHVTVALLNQYVAGYEDLIYPGVSYRPGTFNYAMNTVTDSGRNCIQAITSYLASRYNGGSYGNVEKWIVGNEVNDNLQYNYIGEMDINNYVQKYYQTFKVIHDSITAVNTDATVYIPLEHRWTTVNTNEEYAGRDFLTIFNNLAKADGDFNWGVAFHAYSFPANDPDILNDEYATIDGDGKPTYGDEVSLDSETRLITMLNINVLTDFMCTSNMRDKNGNVRSIILSEQGYTSYSNLYGENEEKQAANIAYAYYKAEMNPYIDAFILKGQADDTGDGHQYYQFGLWKVDAFGRPIAKKQAYNVYKYIDTSDSLNVTSFALNTLGISSWGQVIPNFDANKFNSMKTISTDNMLSFKSMNDISGGSVLSQGMLNYWEQSYNTHGTSIYDHAGNYFPNGTEVTDGNAYYMTYQAIEHKFNTPLSAQYLCFSLKFIPREASHQNDNMVVRVRVHSGSHLFDTDCVVSSAKENNLAVALSNWKYRNAIDKVEIWIKEAESASSFDGVFTLYNFSTATAVKNCTELASTGTIVDMDAAYAKYDAVFNAEYYFKKNPDVASALNNDTSAALNHFISYGMAEGRQGCEEFDPFIYRSNYNDLNAAYGDNIKLYYEHYMNCGKAEGRVADHLINEASYNGVDYSAVYNKEYYYTNNADVAAVIGEDASALIAHFVNCGMAEGRIGSADFNVEAYKYYNGDVAAAFGTDTKQYYMHYIFNGKSEGRRATGLIYNGLDYAAVFDVDYYYNNNGDVAQILGKSQNALLQHFVQFGMAEGRKGNVTFDVNAYRTYNEDVAAAFGNNIAEYYLHYINYGKNEGRTCESDTVYEGVDYSAVYNKEYYTKKNSDVAAAFGDNPRALIAHFVINGMAEGRQAAEEFNVAHYKDRYQDLQKAFGNDYKSYYMHYVNCGKAEGRNGK